MVTKHSIARLGFLFSLLLASAAQFIVLAQNVGARGESGYVVFVSQRSGAAELYLLHLETRQVSQLTNTGRGQLLPSVALGSSAMVYAQRAGSNYELFAATFRNGLRTGRPTFVSTQRLTMNTTDEVSPTISADGRRIAFASSDGLEVMEADGTQRRIVLMGEAKGRAYNPALSPDGSQLAFIATRPDGNEEICLLDLTTGEQRQLTNQARPLGGLNWSPDGKLIAFTSANTTSKLPGIALIQVASGGYHILCELGDSNPSFSPDGKRLLFTSMRDGDAELYLMTLTAGTAERLTFSPGLDDGASFIPALLAPQRLPVRP